MIFNVQETFGAFQGEGDHMGRAAYFVRLMGCDQRCEFCDAAATWHPDWKPANARRLTERDIADHVNMESSKRAFVVLTGGEPTLYDLEPLVSELHRIGRRVHLETAGHRPMSRRLLDAFDWITLSPKGAGAPPCHENNDAAHEFKIIVESAESLERDLSLIYRSARRKSVWLHPEWSQRNNPKILRLITETVKSAYPCGDSIVRAGWQLHKNYKCDALDPRSAPPVPLGGQHSKGDSI